MVSANELAYELAYEVANEAKMKNDCLAPFGIRPGVTVTILLAGMPIF